MPNYYIHPTAGPGRNVLVVEKQTRTWSKLLGTQIETIYKGRQNDIEWHYTNRATAFPNAKEVEMIQDFEDGGWWAIRVLDGIQLNSTWEIDSTQNNVPLSGSDMGAHLDFAFPGWPRYIEIKINEWYAAETANQRFALSTIKSSSLSENPSGAAVLNTQYLNQAQLDALAEKYALAYLTGQDTFFEPRWVIRNQITVSPDYAFDPTSVLYTEINWMLGPSAMADEGLNAGETVPAGIIVPGVNWWHKQPFRLIQTTENQTVISREWWGANFFNVNIYNSRL